MFDSSKLYNNFSPYPSWKGQTFGQITSSIQRNSNATLTEQKSYNQPTSLAFLPPPLKIYSLVRILKSSVSVIVFSKSTPVNSESSNLNKVDSFELHEISNTPKKGSIIMGLQNDLIKKAIE